MTRNFFLHIHAPKVHLYSLRPTYTWGLGLMAAFLFLFLLVTGALLMLYYTPSVERAYDSVKDIMFVVPAGRYLRNMHRWAAHALVLVAFLHAMRVFYTGSYVGRRLNWVIGVALLFVTLLLSFSGYLLPWDQLAYWAITIGSNIAASFRELTDALRITAFFDIGGLVKNILIGGETVGQAALTRFYMLHIIFLPLLLMVLLALHLWRIRKDGGLSRPANADEIVAKEIEPNSLNNNQSANFKIYAWPTALWAELAVLMLIGALLFLAAYVVDAPLLEHANPAVPENPAKSPWYFLGIQELVSYSAFSGGILIPLGFLAFLVSIPFKDTQENYLGEWFSGSLGKKIMRQSALFALLFTAALFALHVSFGWINDWFPGTPQLLLTFVNPGTLTALAYILWSIYVQRKWQSTRMAAIALFTCVMLGYLFFTLIGIYFRGPNWEFYWLKSQWPAL